MKKDDEQGKSEVLELEHLNTLRKLHGDTDWAATMFEESAIPEAVSRKELGRRYRAAAAALEYAIAIISRQDQEGRS